MDLAQYQTIKKELKEDREKAHKRNDTREVAVCNAALNTLKHIRKAQGF